jgi:archaellum component FlaD/FlaE
MINLNTLSEHARSHRNESETDEDESEYTDDESEYSEEDEDAEDVAAIEKETEDINAAIRESAMESEIMGNMNEDDALAAALALSNEDQPKLETRFGGMTLTPNETDTIDCNDVNCD